MALATASFAGSESPGTKPATGAVLRSNGSDHRDGPHSGNTKRHPAYIAPKTTFSKLLKAADVENRWDRVSATIPSRGSIGGTPQSDSNVTAGEPEARFRASISAGELADAFASTPHGRRGASPDTASISSFSVPETPPAAPVQKELKPRFSRSRRVGLSQARKEALAIQKRRGLGAKESIACDRPGCTDALRDVKALAYHLHIHNIHDRSYRCPQCDGLYECRRELAMHICRYGPKSPPLSPLKRFLGCLFPGAGKDSVDDV